MPDAAFWDIALPVLAPALAFGYLLGSVPFGLLLTRLAGHGDIRAMGSGNIGATNVLRTGHKGLAAATLAGDLLKGTLAVIAAAGLWGAPAGLAAAAGAFLGHLFPVWIGFRGGKGVATYLGVLLAVSWPAGLAFAGIWLVTAYLLRYSSLAALVAAAATPLVLALLESWYTVPVFAVLTMLLFLAHRENIARLLRGQESRIGGGAAGE